MLSHLFGLILTPSQEKMFLIIILRLERNGPSTRTFAFHGEGTRSLKSFSVNAARWTSQSREHVAHKISGADFDLENRFIVKALRSSC